MLSPADNERLTRVGPGTPMGGLFRRYWLPALLSEEVPERDGAPKRVRLLGEDFVALRGSDRAVGLISDVTVDAYPTWEGGGMIWAYLGPADLRPELPGHELLRAPATHRHVSKSFEDCNFLQALEGGIDPTHASIMHNMNIGDRSFLNRYDELVAELHLDRTDYGFTYAGIRSRTTDTWVRGYHWIMPSFHMRATVEGTFGSRADVPTIDGHIWIPIDDEQTWVYSFAYSHDPARPLSPEKVQARETRLGRGDFLDANYRSRLNRANDYEIDRKVQREKTMTGIQGINTQDLALQEGMGRIADRSKEHLGTTDRAIITLRQILLESLDTLARGERPKALDPASYRNVRSFDRVIDNDSEWRSATKADVLTRF